MKPVFAPIIRTVLLLALLLVSLAGAGWYWLLHTHSGALMVLSVANRFVAGEISFQSAAGDLGAGLTISALDYRLEDLQAGAAIVRIALNANLLPPSLEVTASAGQTVSIRRQSAQDATSPLERPLQGIRPILGKLRTPFPIRLSALEIDHVAGYDDDELAWELHNIEASMDIGRRLELHALSVAANGQQWRATGHLNPDAPFDADFEISATVPDLATQQPGRVARITARLNGRLDHSLALVAAVDQPDVSLSGEVSDLFEVPQWNLAVQLEAIQLGDTRISAGIQTRGSLRQFTADGEARLVIESLEPIETVLTVSGDGDGMEFSSIALSSPHIEMQGEGEVFWRDALAASFDIELKKLALSALPPGWIAEPGNHIVNGRLRLQWSQETARLDALDLHVPGTALRLQAKGTFDPNAGIAEADLQWTGLGWPLLSDQPDVVSESGRVLITGSPQDWALSAAIQAGAGYIPEGKLVFDGSGDQSQAQFTIRQGELLGGSVAGEGNIDWQDAVRLRANLKSEQLDIGALLPRWPGRLSSHLKIEATLPTVKQDTLHAVLDIESLSGTLLEQPLAGRGSVNLRGQRLAFEHLDLTVGEASVALHGDLFDAGGLEFTLRADELGDFPVEARGSIAAGGHIRLVEGWPTGALEFAGSDLQWQQLSAQQLSLSATGGESAHSATSLTATAEGISIANQHVSALQFVLAGDRIHQQLNFTAEQDAMALSSTVRGQLADGNFGEGARWTGEVSQLAINESNLGALTLSAPVAIELTRDLIQLDRACLDLAPIPISTAAEAGQQSPPAAVCLAGQWADGATSSVAIDMRSLPLDLVNLFHATGLRYSQRLDGRLKLESGPGMKPSGEGSIVMTPGAVYFSAEDGDSIMTDRGDIHFQLEQGRLHSGSLVIPLIDAGLIDIEFSSPDIGLGPDTAIRGSADIELRVTQRLSDLIPLTEVRSGALKLNAKLGGTIGDPSLSSTVAFTDGDIYHSSLGLHFEQIQFSGDLHPNAQSVLSGQFRAGEGSGELLITADLTDLLQPSVQASIKGSNLQVIDVPQITLVADPDFTLGWRDGEVTIDGRLIIPRARIAPQGLPSPSAEASNDVVIVAGELPFARVQESEKRLTGIRGALEVGLGDDIRLETSIATIKLDGSATFTWNDNLMPVANGSYGLTGRLEAFGQLLRISEGTLRFPDAPANNPHLNIRAERDIWGNSSIRTAGLYITGTLRRPVMEPYTVPMTNRDRAQTLLVTGSDFDYEQGVGAVDVGMYIAPRLYVSYGIGLFNDENVISVRYDLRRGFGIKGTTGAQENGVDLSYTIDQP